MNKRYVANLLLSSVNAFSLLSGQAFAGAGTITTKDASGATQTFVVVTDGSGHYGASNVICDGTAMANCAQVNASSLLLIDEGAASQFHTDLTAAVPGLNATNCSTNAYSNGQTNPVNVNLNGAMCVDISKSSVAVNQGNVVTPLHVCGTYTTLSMSAVTSQLMILGSSGKTIYICDFDISNSSTSTTTLNFAIGTGTNCANGSSVLGQNWYLNGNWGKGAANSYYRGLSSAALASASLCAKSSNTTTVDIGVYYDQY